VFQDGTERNSIPGIYNASTKVICDRAKILYSETNKEVNPEGNPSILYSEKKTTSRVTAEF
jgi:hypothetical protein